MTHGFGMDQPAAAPSLPWPGCFPGSGRRLLLICAGPAGAPEKALLGLLPPSVDPRWVGQTAHSGAQAPLPQMTWLHAILSDQLQPTG